MAGDHRPVVSQTRSCTLYVVEDGCVQVAVGQARVVGDPARFDILHPAVEDVRWVAVTRIEDDQRPTVGLEHRVDHDHELPGDARSAGVGLDERLPDLGPVPRVGLRRQLPLDRSDDPAVGLGNQQDGVLVRQTIPVRPRLGHCQRRQEADRRAGISGRDEEPRQVHPLVNAGRRQPADEEFHAARSDDVGRR